MNTLSQRFLYHIWTRPKCDESWFTIKNFTTLLLLTLLNFSTTFAQKNAKSQSSFLAADNTRTWAVNTPSKDPLQLNYQKYITQDGIVYRESEYSLNPSLLAAAGSPCTATRWDAGDHWVKDASGNWTGTAATGQTQP